MEFLTFQLYGPMASWGDTAVGEYRPSTPQPSKSAIMGLVAAALGILRTDEDAINHLNSGFDFAVRVDTPGEMLRDYHTTQVPPMRKGIHYHTRQNELNQPSLNTILSQRDYRVDSAYVVALWKNNQTPYDLATLADALRKPKFVLFLGRKSCPLSLPLNPNLVTADNLRAAFDQIRMCKEFLPLLPHTNAVTWFWEDSDACILGMEPDMNYPRHDKLLSRKRWQFGNRQEYSHFKKEGAN